MHVFVGLSIDSVNSDNQVSWFLSQTIEIDFNIIL